MKELDPTPTFILSTLFLDFLVLTVFSYFSCTFTVFYYILYLCELSSEDERQDINQITPHSDTKLGKRALSKVLQNGYHSETILG